MDFFSNRIFLSKQDQIKSKCLIQRIFWGFPLKLISDQEMDQGMDQANLDDFMENDLANMAERDAEVELVMAEYDAGDQGGDAGYDVND